MESSSNRTKPSGSGGNVPEKPSGDGGGGAPGSSSSASVSYSGATEIASDTTTSESYKSTTGGQNAVLVSGGTVNFLDVSVTKTGDESSENSDFYGTNAAVLVYNGATLVMKSGSVETDASHANAVFAYGDGKISLNGTKIVTSGNNSGGIMVTGGGSLTAENVTVKTSGNSAAAIRSDRGGGTMKVTGGTYETSGTGSPAIYSTAKVTVTDATLSAMASEGVVIEGKNSVTLTGVKLVDTNNKLNGNSETYKNIFIYQSMSGDADEGVGSFTASSSEIVTNKGDTFFVTNTTAEITLSGNSITNNDKTGVLLRAQSGKWGTSGNNGGIVTMTWNGQQATGDIVLDEISTLNFVLAEGSYYKGALNSGNTAENIECEVSADSIIVLTGDSYVTSLANEDDSNTNIYANGYKLFVNGTEVAINQSKNIPEMVVGTLTTETTEDVTATKTDAGVPGWVWWTIGGVILAIIVAVVAVLMMKNRKRKGNGPEMPPSIPSTPSTPVPPVVPPVQ